MRADRSRHVVRLWPPNHKFHLVSIEQCLPALARCEPGLDPEFSWASSDEPIDGIGDGHHAPDLFRVDREHVCVRSERQGPKNGRVYRLGISFIDADDRRRETECLVVIDHDQRGAPAQDDQEQYLVEFEDAADRDSCDGAGAPGAPPRDDAPPRTPDEPGVPAPPDGPDAPDPDEPSPPPDEPSPPPDEPEDIDGPR